MILNLCKWSDDALLCPRHKMDEGQKEFTLFMCDNVSQNLPFPCVTLCCEQKPCG